MRRLGVVTGLAFEAQCLADLAREVDLHVRVSGADSRRAKSESDALIAAGCTALLSFGIAGGLDPALSPGALVVATSVIDPAGRRLPASADWSDRLAARLGDARRGAIAGTDIMITQPPLKRRLHIDTHALAVDMESHAVAHAATTAGIPFAVLRAIADHAETRLPQWLSGVVKPDGSIRPFAVAAQIVLKPWEIGTLIGLGRANTQATAALRRAVSLLGRELLA